MMSRLGVGFSNLFLFEKLNSTCQLPPQIDREGGENVQMYMHLRGRSEVLNVM